MCIENQKRWQKKENKIFRLILDLSVEKKIKKKRMREKKLIYRKLISLSPSLFRSLWRPKFGLSEQVSTIAIQINILAFEFYIFHSNPLFFSLSFSFLFSGPNDCCINLTFPSDMIPSFLNNLSNMITVI